MTDSEIVAGLRELANALGLGAACRWPSEKAEHDRMLRDRQFCTLAADRLAAGGAWTATLPTVAGWYWWRYDETCDRVKSIEKVEPNGCHGGLQIKGVPLAAFGGEWSGPQSPPTPPAREEDR